MVSDYNLQPKILKQILNSKKFTWRKIDLNSKAKKGGKRSQTGDTRENNGSSQVFHVGRLAYLIYIERAFNFKSYVFFLCKQVSTGGASVPITGR